MNDDFDEDVKVFRTRLPECVVKEAEKLALFDNCSVTDAIEFLTHLGFSAILNDDWVNLAVPTNIKMSRVESKRVVVAGNMVELVRYFQDQCLGTIENIFSFVTLNGLEYMKAKKLKNYRGVKEVVENAV